MKLMKHIYRYLIGTLLLVVSPFVLADTSSLTEVAFGSSQVNEYTDVSIGFLSQFFGTVGNVLHGVTGQVLGKMFYVFNTGILIAAGIWLCYTVLSVLLKSSQEGSFSGQNRNAAVIFLRIALGVAFLVPSPATGYSVLQAVVAKIVVQGVDMANMVWNKALDYMNEGGTLFTIPDSQGSGVSVFDSMGDLTNVIGSIKNVLASEVCFYQANSARPDGESADIIVDEENYQVQFPGPSDDPNALSLSSPGCGAVSWDIGGSCSEGGSVKCDIYKQAVFQVITDLWQTAIDYTQTYPIETADDEGLSSDNTNDDLPSQARNTIAGAVLDYVNLALPASRLENITEDQEDFYKMTARQGGWIMAGAFYWQLVRYNEDISSATHGSLEVMTPDQNFNEDGYADQGVAVGPDIGNWGDENSYDPNYVQANEAVEALELTEISERLNLMANQVIPVLTNDDIQKDNAKKWYIQLKRRAKVKLKHIIKYNKRPGKALKSAATLITVLPLKKMLLPALRMNKVIRVLQNTEMNPLIWGRKLGLALLELGSSLMTTLTYAFMAAGMLGGSRMMAGMGVSIGYGLGTIMSFIVGMLKLMVLPLVIMCVLAGLVLAFYLPLYPYFLFSFGVMSWLISVLESMIAAPIVALGLTHPEGHDMLGRAEVSLIMWLNVFVRPSLMVFALIAGILLSYIGLEFVQLGISHTLFRLFVGSGDTNLAWKTFAENILPSAKYTILQPVLFMAVVSIYVFFIYQITVNAFATIYYIPNRVMRWIGGQEQHDDSQSRALQGQGMLAQGGGQVGKMGSDDIGQAMKGFSDKKKDAEKQKAQEKKAQEGGRG
jgi:defect-in-organelle-trafficking protein DotA